MRPPNIPCGSDAKLGEFSIESDSSDVSLPIPSETPPCISLSSDVPICRYFNLERGEEEEEEEILDAPLKPKQGGGGGRGKNK
jgi:hypothetical protein